MSLATGSPELARLQSLFDSTDAAVRRVALREAADACTPELLPLLERALSDAEPEVRLEAVLALDAIGGAEAVAPLIQALADGDEEVREAARLALAELKAAEGAEPLLRALSQSREPWILAALLEALKPLQDPRTLPPALELLAHADAGVRAAAVGAIGYLRLPQPPTPVFGLSAGDAVAAVRLAALRALSSAAPELLAPAAQRSLSDPEWSIRAEAAAILGRLHHAAAADALAGLADFDPHWQVREQAVEALGLLQHKPAIPAIGRCLAAPVSNLRKTAVLALGRMQDRSVALLLAGVRHDPDAQVRKLANQLLERLEGAAA
jgi:HEAT repeat protein